LSKPLIDLSEKTKAGIHDFYAPEPIDHGLQADRVRHEFIVDDGLLLIGGVVGSKQSIPTERQVFGKLMVPLDDCGCIASNRLDAVSTVMCRVGAQIPRSGRSKKSTVLPCLSTAR
jgi:hypothetical protein